MWLLLSFKNICASFQLYILIFYPLLNVALHGVNLETPNCTINPSTQRLSYTLQFGEQFVQNYLKLLWVQFTWPSHVLLCIPVCNPCAYVVLHIPIV